ncbi:phospholipase A2 inhibitor and Ly6/PLAUR domain-containing protein-like [Spea bombifrons]|uniref:phospholipase A2 inhibitor and Ly6/PLAUR domain-containing protein-like n=1 Tax=Spea bombifrons TaxID=233779 RepID=UPI002349FDC4|nr:phospholipase A2 inhibitor and Ly6/PLAUR domain-containing protein-like [Spea bombifrons]
MFLIAVYSALLAAGLALECEVCYSLNSNSCSGHYKTCDPSHNRCMETLRQTSIGDLRSVVLEKSCGSVYNCTHPARLTTPGYSISITTICCDTDYCNNRTMKWETANTTLNGVRCPSCFAKDSETCDNRKTMNCTGMETGCIQFTVSRPRGSTITLAGCASESIEMTQGQAAFWGNSIKVTGFRTFNGAESLRAALLPPALTFLVVVKLFVQ